MTNKNDTDNNAKNIIDEKIDNLIHYLDNTYDDYNSTIYNWLLLLNSGGLIGTITLISVKPHSVDYVVVCALMFFLFLMGIISTFIAIRLEMDRMKKKKCRVLAIYQKYKDDRVDYNFLIEQANIEFYPVGLIDKLEKCSFALFLVAVIVGAFFIILNPEAVCTGLPIQYRQLIS